MIVQEYEAPASTSGLLHSHPGFSWDQFINKIRAREFLSQGLLLRELGLRQQPFSLYLVGFDKYCHFLPEASPYPILGDDLKFLNT